MNPNKDCREYYTMKDYPVDIESSVHPYLRSHDSESRVPAPPVNGGLYCGPQNNAPWMPKSVPPTTTFFMQELVKNADPKPPPGASEQYPGDNRMGNNYTSMPGVNWYDSAYERNKGPFNIKVVNDKWNTEEGRKTNNLVASNSNSNSNPNNMINSFDLTQYRPQ